MPTAFLCHSSNDKPEVRDLAERLNAEGVEVWLDESELKIGDSIVEKISSAIHESDFVIAVLSPHSVESHWVQKELNLAMTKEISGKRKVVLPVLLHPCELPDYLRDKLYADFTNSEARPRQFAMLIEAIAQLFGELQPRPARDEQKSSRGLAAPRAPGTPTPVAVPTSSPVVPVRTTSDATDHGPYGKYGEGVCYCGGSLEHVGRGRGDHRILRCDRCGSVEWVY